MSIPTPPPLPPQEPAKPRRHWPLVLGAMMRRLLAVAAATLALLAAFVLAPQQASAEQIGWRYQHKTICVDNNAPHGSNYYYAIDRAARQINDETVLNVKVVNLSSCSASTYDQIVVASALSWSANEQGHAVPNGYDWGEADDGKYHWLVRTGSRLELNTRYGPRSISEWTRTATHELLHLVGLDHTDRCDSVMHTNYSECGYDWRLTAFDAAEVKRLYPTISLVAPRLQRR